MSMNSTIYVGVWTNWSQGAIMGSTLTLSAQHGTILISVLTLFIRLIGGRTWGIICFIAHQLRTTKEAKDGLYHQQQATLRNNASDIQTLWQLTKISWSWRPKTSNSIRKSLGLIVFGTIHLLLFAAAGTFSSHLVTLGNEVLLSRSPSCGPWAMPTVSNESQLAEGANYELYSQNTIALSSQYVSNCLTQLESSSACNTFRQAQLNWTSMTEAPCPFEDDLCLGPANSSLRLDTGLIDSRDDLGINGDDAHRVQYRKTATCVPITTEGYFENGTNSFSNGLTYNYTAAFYGPNNVLPSELEDSGGIPNATYVHSNFMETVLRYDSDQVSGIPYYTVSAEPGYFGDPSDGFTPLPAFKAENQTIALVFASFVGAYTGPSDDLWLSAHRLGNAKIEFDGNDSLSLPEYRIDKPVSVLACTEQHQFCNPNPASNLSNRCTPFLSLDNYLNDGSDPISPLLYNDYQSIIAKIIHFAVLRSGIYPIVSQLNPPIMAAGLAAGGVSPPLPDNQWVLEATNWFSIGLNNLQRMMVDVATGPPGKDAHYTTGLADQFPSLQWYCDNQIVQREDFLSFNVLALALIFVFGALVTVVSLFLESIVGFFQLKFKRGLYHQVRWQLDSTVQLQRMAFEEAGLGTWSGGADDVPVTEKDEKFGPATEWDEWHPSICGKAIVKHEASWI
ncbi:uncharacterized protein PAC_17649 [Phialocephala subalpina]|uniref:Uncharacterized protein n=1 Tax=Phialocephala subalpina TaxID=576137 RepID=A0A1L7XRU5_9HELO|nr:uncharacterized protein PAC_17649 [Phialocephala subalpina]